jgi:hypothetical protein
LPWTWLRMLPSLSFSSAPQLVACLVVLGAALLTVADRRLAVLAFLLLRATVLILLWPAIRGVMGAVSAATLLAIAIICTMSECRLRQARFSEEAHPTGRSAFLMTPLFRALAASLGMLLAHGFVEAYARDLAPLAVMLTSAWLVVLGMLALLLSSSGLGTAMGVVALADGCRILYALSRPGAWAWALWNVCDVIIVLAGAHLSRAETMAAKSPSGGRP